MRLPPGAREEQVWVRYEPEFKPATDPENQFIGSAPLGTIAPEAVVATRGPL